MRALIMAGGKGQRLKLGEKPLVSICNRPMISYVIDAFLSFGCEVIVAASPDTPMTKNWCRVNGIDLYSATGADYIRDMIEAVEAIDEQQPLFISVSDIPCIDAEVLGVIHDAYDQSGKDACSAWVPVSLVKSCRGGLSYQKQIENIEACPVGINILRGDLISSEQDELQAVILDQRLAINVNTREDRAAAETFLRGRFKKS